MSEPMRDELLLDYALGALSPEAAGEVEAHLRAHPDDAARVRAYLEDLARLTLALSPEPLPTGGEAALLARVRALAAGRSEPAAALETEVETEFSETVLRAPRGRSREHSRSGWWAFAAAALLGALYLIVLGPPGTPPAETVAERLQRYEQRPGSRTYALADETTGEPVGTLVRLQDGRLFVTLDDLSEGPYVCQAWEIRNGTPLSLGIFEGRTLLTPATAEGSVFGMTLEPPGGSEAPTTAPFVLLELSPTEGS